MDPYVKNRLNQIREENKEAFDNGQFDVIFDKYNEGALREMPSVMAIQKYYNHLDTLPPEDESEKKNLVPNDPVDQEEIAAESPSMPLEEKSSVDSSLKGNKETTKALLNYISGLESVGGSYNSYNGSHLQGAEQYDFQNMTLAGVLDWQANNGDKAVGRYQIKPQTLKEMMEKMDLSPETKFSPTVQDNITVELMKRRGYDDYLQGKGYENFAYGMAKEWAGIPLIRPDGEKQVGQSYYEGKGTNKANGDAAAFEKILRQNSGFASQYTQNYFDRENSHRINTFFSSITPDFLRGKSEQEIEIELKKQFAHLGFDVKQTGGGTTDGVKISHPALETEYELNLETENEIELVDNARKLKDWMKGASLSVNPENYYRYYYEESPALALREMINGMTLNPMQVDQARIDLEEKKRLLKSTPKHLPNPDGPFLLANPERKKLEDEIADKHRILRLQDAKRTQMTRTFDNLADAYGGLQQSMQNDSQYAELIDDMVRAGVLKAEDLRTDNILVDGKRTSYSTFRNLILDHDVKEAIWNGDIDVEIRQDGEAFAGTPIQKQMNALIDLAAKDMKQHTMGSGYAGRVDYMLRSTFAPLVASTADIAANVGDTILDVLMMPSNAYDYISDVIVNGGDDEDIQEAVVYKTAAHYDTVFDSLREHTRNHIRSVIPETSGTINESESFGEAFIKGTQGGAESIPYIAAFAVNPSLGLSVTGMSAYGGALDEMAEMQTLAQEIKNNGQVVPESFESYLDMSRAQMRTISFAKAGGETLITAAFTGRYFKNLTGLAQPGMTVKQFREAAKEYRRGYVKSLFNAAPRAVVNEFPEEILISIENNAVDDLFGVRDVSMEQYIRDAGNAASHAAFTSVGMATIGTAARKNNARKIFESQVFKTMLDRNTDYNNLNLQLLQVDKKLSQLQEQGKSNEVLEKQALQIQKELAGEQEKALNLLRGADLNKLTEFVAADIEIQRVIKNAKEASVDVSLDQARQATTIGELDQTNQGDQPAVKKRVTKRLTALVEKQQRIINEINPEAQYKASNDTKLYIDTFVGEKIGDDGEVIMHSTTDVDGVLENGRLFTNETIQEMDEETGQDRTEPDTPDQAGGSKSVFFTRDPKWDQGNRNGKFIFDKSKSYTDFVPGENAEEFELQARGDVWVTRQNGLVGIQLVEGKDVSDEVFSGPQMKGFDISDQEKTRRIIDLDRQNAEEFANNREKIMERAQKAADKYGVPVTITQHTGNFQMYDAVGHKSVIQDVVVYPSNATAEDYASFGNNVMSQVRQAPARTEQEKKYRNAAKILEGIRRIAVNKIPFPTSVGEVTYSPDTIFDRAPKDVQAIIDFFSQLSESELNQNQRRMVDDIINKISDIKTEEDLDKIPMSRIANELSGLSDLVSEINLNKPADLENKKMNAQTVMESLFTLGGASIATTNHVLSNLFKNSRMKQPLLKLSQRIDSNIEIYKKEVAKIRDEYQKLGFLTEKVDPKKYFSDENLAERLILSHLGKYEVTPEQGQQAVKNRLDQFARKKEEFDRYIEEMADETSGPDQKRKQKIYRDIFNDIVAPAVDYASVESRAKSFNKEGVAFLKDMYQKDAAKVYTFMKNYHGRKPTVFANYLPTIFTPSDASGIATNDYVAMGTSYDRSTGNLQESSDQTGPLPGKLNFENYENVLFDMLASSRTQMASMGDVYKLKGFYESKGFSDMFDTESQRGVNSYGDQTDFTRMRDFLLQTLGQKVQRMNQISSNERLAASAGQNFKRVGRSILKATSTRRLGSFKMRPTQYYSAVFAQLPNMGATARNYLLRAMGDFAIFQAQKNLRTDAHKQALLSVSQTQGRSGLAKVGTEVLDKIRYEDFKTKGGRAVNYALDQLDNVSEGIMNYALSQTDILAAQNTYLAFYMDYEMKNNPDVKNMNQEEFFAYAASNVNENAVAYADEQVGRSQTQSDEWNSVGIYGQGGTKSKQILVNALFTFGRFQNNRKVGIVNDIGILNSEFASNADKSMAARRLSSAVIEIGVFKAMSPLIGMAMAKALTPMFASLLGWDEEIDERAAQYKSLYGGAGEDLARAYEFQLSRHERNIAKEFSTSLFDGVIPAPLPSALTELGYGAVNSIAKDYLDVEPFNVYSPYARGLFDDTKTSLTNNGVADAVLSMAGLYQMAAEDGINFYNSLNYLQTDKMPPYMMGGKDRYVRDLAKDGADALALITLVNFFIPSADLNTVQRLLRGKINRDYLTTKVPFHVRLREIEERTKEREKTEAKRNAVITKPSAHRQQVLKKHKVDTAIKNALRE